MNSKRTDQDIQATLRAEIRELQFRHEVRIALLHATYALVMNGPAENLPDIGRQVSTLAKSPLFDASWYLQQNPDVAQSGMNPAEHYVRAGAFEGRNPSPAFDTMDYYFANPDVADAGWPALVHYLHYGKTEGRKISCRI